MQVSWKLYNRYYAVQLKPKYPPPTAKATAAVVTTIITLLKKHCWIQRLHKQHRFACLFAIRLCIELNFFSSQDTYHILCAHACVCVIVGVKCIYGQNTMQHVKSAQCDRGTITLFSYWIFISKNTNGSHGPFPVGESRMASMNQRENGIFSDFGIFMNFVKNSIASKCKQLDKIGWLGKCAKEKLRRNRLKNLLKNCRRTAIKNSHVDSS